MSMQSMLTQDVMERIAVFVGNPVDIVRFGQSGRAFYMAATAAHVWRELAVLKFGEGIAETSAPLYAGDWKSLMVDDNRKGAIPTLSSSTICNYRRNRTSRHYCCIVEQLQWHRADNEIRVYIDVRGEPDLRHPQGSSLVLRNDHGNVLGHEGNAGASSGYSGIYLRRRQISGGFDPTANLVPTLRRRQISGGFDPTASLAPTRFVPDEEPTSRHFKGHLAFSTERIPQAGMYSFCYANAQQHTTTDYLPVNLFQVPEEGGLEMAFKVGDDGPAQYTAGDSPFFNDTPQIELHRWEGAVPADVMNRGWYS